MEVVFLKESQFHVHVRIPVCTVTFNQLACLMKFGMHIVP
jgi:hypothetical protein